MGDDTTLGRICQLVEEAEVHRAPIQRAADTYAKYFTPAILLIASVVYLLTRDWIPAITVLIVACPCALVIATPTGIIAGVANGARRGILIKGGARLEMAGRVNAVALDKTGTITMGEPQVLDVVPLAQLSEQEILGLAAQAEKFSEHPLGRCVVARAKEMGLDPSDPEDFQVVPGRGVLAQSNGQRVVMGTRDLLQEQGVDVSQSTREAISRLENEGKTALPLALNGQVMGLIGVADMPRSQVREAVADLKDMGIRRVVMLTGDNPRVAERIAQEARIDEYYAELLPEQKVERVRQLQASGYRVAMVGDGINDAPALATADAAIAMGTAGTDVAMDTADIILMTDDVTKVAEAIGLARKTWRIIIQNLGFALFWNVAAVIAAGFGELSPVQGALVHNVGSVAVVVNSARLVGTRNLRQDYPFLPQLRWPWRRRAREAVGTSEGRFTT